MLKMPMPGDIVSVPGPNGWVVGRIVGMSNQMPDTYKVQTAWGLRYTDEYSIAPAGEAGYEATYGARKAEWPENWYSEVVIETLDEDELYELPGTTMADFKSDFTPEEFEYWVGGLSFADFNELREIVAKGLKDATVEERDNHA